MKFCPKNRYLLVQTEKQEDTDTGVLLPEGYMVPKDKYTVATVLRSAPDCKECISAGTMVVVDATMLEEVSVLNESYEIIMENYVVGVFSKEE